MQFFTAMSTMRGTQGNLERNTYSVVMLPHIRVGVMV